EQVPDDWEPGKTWHLVDRILRQVVEQSSNGKRLAVAQLDVGFRAPSRQRRDAESRQRDPVGEIQCADLGPNLEANGIARDRRREVQADSVFLVLNRDAVAEPLDDRHRNLTAGEK